MILSGDMSRWTAPSSCAAASPEASRRSSPASSSGVGFSVPSAAFAGIDGISPAIEYGAKVTGVTVHFVDEGVDTGAIILQRAIEDGDITDRAELHGRLRPLEHALLPEAVRKFAAGAVSIDPAW